MPFLLYAIRGFVDELRTEIRDIRTYQLDLFWRHYLHESLGDSETGRRRRYLVLDLGDRVGGETVPRGKLTELSVRVYRHYQGKNEKMLQRDLRVLEEKRLIVREGDQFSANKNVVLAFLPPKSK